MKTLIKLPAIYIFFALVMLSACHRTTTDTLPPELVEAGKLVNQYPDSALVILENMHMPPASHRLQHATWALLVTEAKYKSFRDIDSDSLINIAASYFMSQDDPHAKARTLFMQASLNRLWNNPDTAIEYFLAASTEVEKTENYSLAFFINTGLTNIYIYRNLYDYAEKTLDKAYQYARQSGSRRSEATAWIYYGRLYTLLEQRDKSIEAYEKAIEIAREANATRPLSNAQNEIAGVYLLDEDYHEALRYTNESIKTAEKLNRDLQQSYITKGEIFVYLGQPDSAYYYLTPLLNTDNLYVRRAALWSMYNQKKAERNYKEALDYYVEMSAVSDTIHEKDRTEILVEMQEKYNQEKVLNEKNQLQIEKDRVVRQALWGIIFLLFVIALITYIYQRKLLRNQQTIRRHEERIRNYTLQLHENESQISLNESRINELLLEMEQNKDVLELLEEQQKAIAEIQHRNQTLSNENRELKDNITYYSQSLKQKVVEMDKVKQLSEENQWLRNREKFLSGQLLKRIDILNEIKSRPKYLDEKQWQKVIEAVDWLYNGFTQRLGEEIPSLTESDIQICCLIKLRISISDIATLLAISPTSVSKRKIRLKERIIQELGNPFEDDTTLDMWLWEYNQTPAHTAYSKVLYA